MPLSKQDPSGDLTIKYYNPGLTKDDLKALLHLANNNVNDAADRYLHELGRDEYETNRIVKNKLDISTFKNQDVVQVLNDLKSINNVRACSYCIKSLIYFAENDARRKALIENNAYEQILYRKHQNTQPQ